MRGMVDLAEIIAAAGTRAPDEKGGHSQLYEVMWRDFDALAPALNPPRRPNWRAVAARYGEAGVTDGMGRPLTADRAERVRKTWWQVRKDRDRLSGPPAPSSPPPTAPAQPRAGRAAQDAAKPPAPAPSAPPPGIGILPAAADEGEDGTEFGFFRPKDWTSKGN